jgi:hypothetical protein
MLAMVTSAGVAGLPGRRPPMSPAGSSAASLDRGARGSTVGRLVDSRPTGSDCMNDAGGGETLFVPARAGGDLVKPLALMSVSVRKGSTFSASRTHPHGARSRRRNRPTRVCGGRLRRRERDTWASQVVPTSPKKLYPRSPSLTPLS